jgi:hypothetical protein
MSHDKTLLPIPRSMWLGFTINRKKGVVEVILAIINIIFL